MSPIEAGTAGNKEQSEIKMGYIYTEGVSRTPDLGFLRALGRELSGSTHSSLEYSIHFLRFHIPRCEAWPAQGLKEFPAAGMAFQSLAAVP